MQIPPELTLKERMQEAAYHVDAFLSRCVEKVIPCRFDIAMKIIDFEAERTRQSPTEIVQEFVDSPLGAPFFTALSFGFSLEARQGAHNWTGNDWTSLAQSLEYLRMHDPRSSRMRSSAIMLENLAQFITERRNSNGCNKAECNIA